MNPPGTRPTYRLVTRARLAALVDADYVWAIAPRLEHSPRTRTAGGRRNTHPVWVFLLWMILTHEFGSSRKVEEELLDASHGLWDDIRTAAARALGDTHPELVPPAEAPTRNQFNYALSTHLAHNAEVIREFTATWSRQLAEQLGLGTDDAPGSLSSPSVQRIAFGDVTVMKPRSRRRHDTARHIDKQTGEVTVRRHDPDAALHTTGGGEVVHGLPWAITHVRGPVRNQQVILACDPVTPDGPTEADLVVDQYLQATTDLSGLTGYAYDRALRGRHLDRLLKHGHLGLVGTHRKDGKPRQRHHGPETIHHPDGTTSTIDLHLIGGHPHVVTHDTDGNRLHNPLTRTRIIRRAPRTPGGHHRMYAEYDVPATPGRQGGTVRLRLDQTRDDTARRYNRPEHLRAIPEGDPTFRAVQHPLRATAESANRTIDDHLPRERLLHYGFERNTISMYAWQAYRNTLTAAVFTPSHTATGVDPPTGQIAA